MHSKVKSHRIGDILDCLTDEERNEEDIIIDALKTFRHTDCDALGAFDKLANSLRGKKNMSPRFAHYFMSFYDFKDQDIVLAMRRLTRHIHLQGETQTIDAVLMSFANEYHLDNPFAFSGADLVHTITFAITLLNTDVLNSQNKQSQEDFGASVKLATDGKVDDVTIHGQY